jgi:hypothetical protein
MKRMLVLLIVSVALPATTLNAQPEAPLATATSSYTLPMIQQVSPQRGPTTTWAAPSVILGTRAGDPHHEERREMNTAIEAYRDAASEADKTDARNKIEELLAAQYDRSLDNYDKYLEELSAKIEEMREQVSRRRAARDEIVKLKLQMVVSEADGLGWPDEGRSFGAGTFNLFGDKAFQLYQSFEAAEIPAAVAPVPPPLPAGVAR